MAGIKKETLKNLEGKNKILTISVIILSVFLLCGLITAIFLATNSKVTEKDWTPYTLVSFSTDGENWLTDKREFQVNEVVYMKIIIETKVHKLLQVKPTWHECALIIPNSKDVLGKLVSAKGSENTYQPLKGGLDGYSLSFQVPNNDVEIEAKTFLVRFIPIEEGESRIRIQYVKDDNKEKPVNFWTDIRFSK